MVKRTDWTDGFLCKSITIDKTQKKIYWAENVRILAVNLGLNLIVSKKALWPQELQQALRLCNKPQSLEAHETPIKLWNRPAKRFTVPLSARPHRLSQTDASVVHIQAEEDLFGSTSLYRPTRLAPISVHTCRFFCCVSSHLDLTTVLFRSNLLETYSHTILKHVVINFSAEVISTKYIICKLAWNLSLFMHRYYAWGGRRLLLAQGLEPEHRSKIPFCARNISNKPSSSQTVAPERCCRPLFSIHCQPHHLAKVTDLHCVSTWFGGVCSKIFYVQANLKCLKYQILHVISTQTAKMEECCRQSQFHGSMPRYHNCAYAKYTASGAAVAINLKTFGGLFSNQQAKAKCVYRRVGRPILYYST